MTKKDLMDVLKANGVEFNAKAKKAELEQLYVDYIVAVVDEETAAEETVAVVDEEEEVPTFADGVEEVTFEEEMKQLFGIHNVIPAHGGLALKTGRKRICEITQSKKTKLYKVAFHKDTYERAKVLLKDFHCEEQKHNYVVRHLNNMEVVDVVTALIDHKK